MKINVKIYLFFLLFSCSSEYNLISNQHQVIDVKNLIAGIVLEGSDAAVSLSDYVLGPSHILPTNSSSRFTSPLSVEDFMVSSTKVGIKSEANKDLYNKLIDKASILESIVAFKRAGASAIVTYFALDILRNLNKN